jgi:hypothetical protein
MGYGPRINAGARGSETERISREAETGMRPFALHIVFLIRAHLQKSAATTFFSRAAVKREKGLESLQCVGQFQNGLRERQRQRFNDGNTIAAGILGTVERAICCNYEGVTR